MAHREIELVAATAGCRGDQATGMLRERAVARARLKPVVGQVVAGVVVFVWAWRLTHAVLWGDYSVVRAW